MRVITQLADVGSPRRAADPSAGVRARTVRAMTTINSTYGYPKICRLSGCDAGACFYCGAYLSNRHEHDHFPTPKRHGGGRTVPACLNCHDLKDRVPLSKWPVGGVVVGLTGLLAVLPPMPLACVEDGTDAVLRAMLDVVRRCPDLAESDRWGTLATPTRLVYAKLRASQLDFAARAA